MARYSLNHAAFATLTEASAYWAGFLMADGCVYIRGTQVPVIRLGLAATEVEHLQAFCRFMGTERPIYLWTTDRAPREGLQVPGRYHGAAVSFTSRQVAADLARLGITPRKTLTAKASDAVAMNRHFWRGVVDGDGYIGRGGTGRATTVGKSGRQYGRGIGLYGSRDIVSQFRSFLVANGVPVEAVVHCRGRHYSLTLKGGVADKTVELLYKDATDVLSRKMALAKEHFLNIHYIAPLSRTGAVLKILREVGRPMPYPEAFRLAVSMGYLPEGDYRPRVVAGAIVWMVRHGLVRRLEEPMVIGLP